MDNLFLTLHSIVFPLLGRYLGLLGGIAMTPYQEVVDCFLGVGGGFACVNLYTGVSFLFNGFNLGLLGVVVNLILTPALSVFTICCDILFIISPIPTTQIPFAVAIICFSLTFGFIFGMTKWLIDFIS